MGSTRRPAVGRSISLRGFRRCHGKLRPLRIDSKTTPIPTPTRLISSAFPFLPRNYEHRFVHRRAVGSCRIRAYEELGERSVLVATQQRAPQAPDPLSVLQASRL